MEKNRFPNYICTRTNPGINKGTIIKPINNSGGVLYYYFNDNNETDNSKKHISSKTLREYPNFFMEEDTSVLCVPVESYIIRAAGVYQVGEPYFYEKSFKFRIKLYRTNNVGSVTYEVDQLNKIIEKENIIAYETKEDAVKVYLRKQNILSIEDVAKIFTSADNDNYEQADKLLKLVKDKLNY